MTLRSIAIIQRGQTIPVWPGASAPVLSQEPAIVEVHIDEPAAISFNDEPQKVSQRGGFYSFAIDLSREIGFHRVSVATSGASWSCDLQTVGAGATWKQIQVMSKLIGEHIFRFKRQFVYATPTGPRRAVYSPFTEYGWIRERYLEIERLVRSINQRPASERRARLRTSLSGRGMVISATLRMLRENRDMLEESQVGIVEVGGRKYAPLAVKARVMRRVFTDEEHRNLASFITQLGRSCARLKHELPIGDQHLLGEMSASFELARRAPVLAKFGLRSVPAQYGAVPSFIERTDLRYARIRALHHEHSSQICPFEDGSSAIRLNVKDAWEIFQSFVAHAVGRAYQLDLVSDDGNLRSRDDQGRSMKSSRYDLYYDVHPSKSLITPWRSETTRPAYERPDILLHDRQLNRVALIEVKYRAGSEGNCAHPDDLFEVQGYLNSFGLQNAVLAFAGANLGNTIISARGNTIAELSVLPSDLPSLEAEIKSALNSAWQSL